MVRGAKRNKGQRTEEKSTSHLKNDKRNESSVASKPLISDENREECTSKGHEDNKQYQKGEIKSNWHRFEEPDVDRNADVTRGRDYEVLLSYHGGAGSQMQLQEEREWEEQNSDIKSPVFDLNFLCNAYKCIPFHKQIHVLEDIFDMAQIHRFDKCAEVASKAFASMHKQDDSQDHSTPEVKSIDEEFYLDIVEKTGSENMSESVAIDNSTLVLPEKTENLIESLTSCLSLKERNEKTGVQEEKSVESSGADELDFLLSMSSQETSNNTHSDQPKKTNIDDWLNDLLDD